MYFEFQSARDNLSQQDFKKPKGSTTFLGPSPSDFLSAISLARGSDIPEALDD